MLRHLSTLSISCLLTACVAYPLDWYDPCQDYDCQADYDDDNYEPVRQYSNVTYSYTVNDYRFDAYVNCRDVIGSSPLPRFRYNVLINDCMRSRGFAGRYRWMADNDLRNKTEYQHYRERHDKNKRDDGRPKQPPQAKSKSTPANPVKPLVAPAREVKLTPVIRPQPALSRPTTVRQAQRVIVEQQTGQQKQPTIVPVQRQQATQPQQRTQTVPVRQVIPQRTQKEQEQRTQPQAAPAPRIEPPRRQRPEPAQQVVQQRVQKEQEQRAQPQPAAAPAPAPAQPRALKSIQSVIQPQQ